MDKQKLWLFVSGAILAACVFLIYQGGLLDALELKTLDFRFQVRGPLAPKAPIVLVGIDQDSFDEFALPWPWPRNLHADLVRKLSQAGAKVIGLDILFTEAKADPREDYDLARAIKDAGNVVLAAELTEVAGDFGPKLTMNLPIPLIREGALGYGPVNLMTDHDGVVRSAQPALLFRDEIYPSFAYRVYQALVASEQSPMTVPTAPYLINFRGPPRTYPVIPYYRVVKGEIDLSYLREKIVLVGSLAPSLHDVFPTPFSARHPTSGVEIQANFVETLLAKDQIIPLGGWLHASIFIALALCAAWVSVTLGPMKGFAAVLALAVTFAAGCVFVFVRNRLWFPLIPSLFGVGVTYGGLTLLNYVQEQRERMRYRAQFSKYVSPDIVEELLENREGLALSGKRRHITVLFSDVRDFTKISEENDPETIVTLLSDYLGKVTKIVFDNGGTVDKFIGDAVMAIFGAPKSYGNDAERAVRTGVEMLRLAAAMAPQWQQAIGRPLKIGVGINTGDAVVGSIGSEIRSDYTAIGDAVNTASRLEGMTKELGVPLLMSEFTAAEVKDGLEITSLGKVQVIGRATPLGVFTTSDIAAAQGIEAVDPSQVRRQQHK